MSVSHYLESLPASYYLESLPVGYYPGISAGSHIYDPHHYRRAYHHGEYLNLEPYRGAYLNLESHLGATTTTPYREIGDIREYIPTHPISHWYSQQ